MLSSDVFETDRPYYRAAISRDRFGNWPRLGLGYEGAYSPIGGGGGCLASQMVDEADIWH